MEFLSEQIRTRQIQRDIILIQEKVEKYKLNLLKTLDEKEISDFKGLMKEREDIEHVTLRVNNVKKEMYEISSDNLGKLRKLIEAKRECTDIKEQQEQQETVVKKKRVDLLYKKEPNDGKCGILTLCSLGGGVAIQSNQLVHVFDERQASGGVLLICINPTDPSKEYWRHQVTVADHLSPVVMSELSMYFNGKHNVVFAVGKTVFIVLLQWTGSLHNSVESVSSLVIDDLHESSWITGIQVCGRPVNEDKDEFVIAVNNRCLLRQYHVSGKTLRELDTKDFASSITGVANTGNDFAVISRGRDNVILITADSTLKQSGTLRPQSSSFGILPICVIWTGADWLVLFVSDGKEKQWQVVIFKQTGALIKICCEGTSCSGKDIPVSITRYRNTGFVTFADNTTKSFEY